MARAKGIVRGSRGRSWVWQGGGGGGGRVGVDGAGRALE